MSISAYFFRFSKRGNSTKRPETAAGSLQTIEIRPESGVVNPRITLTRASATPLWNYCYIPEFERYYYITEWTWSGGLWHADMKPDTLATYRPEIMASTQYVLRSASSNDGSVIDTMYPLRSGETQTQVDLDFGFATAIDAGYFVVGVINSGGSTGVVYYVLTALQFRQMLGFMLGQGQSYLNIDDISDALAKAIVNPFQYVVSVMWFPFLPVTGASGENFKFGWWESVEVYPVIGVSAWRALPSKTEAWRNHPLAATRGEYLNNRPFTEAYFAWSLFGTFPLDYNDFKGGINISLRVDTITGVGTLRLMNATTAADLIVSRAQVGVPVQISQQTYDYLGSITSLTSTIAGAVTGNAPLALAGASGMIGNVADAAAPRVLSQGGNGSFDIGVDSPRLVFLHHNVAYDDNVSNGRPLCRAVPLNSLSGYCQTMNADIAIDGTSGEADALKSALDSGVFLE